MNNEVNCENILPWMSKTEIDVIVSYLRPQFKMFEWGCGGSTLFFSKYVKLYRSVEHQVDWFNKIKTQIDTNTELLYVSDDNEYNNYINIIGNFEVKYDAILIDGRERVKCAIMAKDFLKEDGYLFVHDYFKRKRYRPIEDLYALVDGIKNTKQTLAVFKQRTSGKDNN